MKKSKFLKKSLAMLLALMLVVAMIPLSAAASEPALQQVRASVDTETVPAYPERRYLYRYVPCWRADN